MHDDSVLDSEENDIITSINYTVLQHLNDHLVRFVTEVLENAIVVREQERKLKEHTKVWQFAKDLVRWSFRRLWHATLRRSDVTDYNDKYRVCVGNGWCTEVG